MRIALLVAVSMLIASPALSGDPECDPTSASYIQPVAVTPGVPLDRSTDNVLSFCTPILDSDGDAMPAGSVDTCTVEVELPDNSWQPYATSSGVGNGSRFTVTVLEKYDRQIRYFCEGAGGKGVVASATIMFRSGIPASPRLL